MRFESFLLELNLTPEYIFLLFVGATVLFHYICIKWYPFNDIQWKQVDYIWIATAAWGVIWLSADINKSFSETYLQNNDAHYLRNQYALLRDHLEKGIPVCLEYFKSDLSPPTFDDNMKENVILCTTSRSLAAHLPKYLKDSFPTLKEMGFKEFKGQYKYNDYYIKTTQTMVDNYSIGQKKYASIKDKSTPSDFLNILNLLSPALITLACALRFTKVTGEIELAKKKSMST